MMMVSACFFHPVLNRNCSTFTLNTWLHFGSNTCCFLCRGCEDVLTTSSAPSRPLIGLLWVRVGTVLRPGPGSRCGTGRLCGAVKPQWNLSPLRPASLYFGMFYMGQDKDTLPGGSPVWADVPALGKEEEEEREEATLFVQKKKTVQFPPAASPVFEAQTI